VQEIFAVQALQGIRFPELMEWNDEKMAHSYVLPDEALAEVRLPTDEEIARTPAYQLQLGNKHYEEGKLEEAIAAYRRCLEAEPKHADARFNLGVALGDAERYDEALACMEEAVRADPKRAAAYNSLGYLASRRREPQKAISYWEKAIELQPNYAHAHFSLGATLLQTGDYARGFAEYEWRLRMGSPAVGRTSHPKWDGQPIPGKTLMIHTEQGAGDAIQFARYLPLAAERCGKLIAVCPPDLMPLFATLPGVAELREPGRLGVAEFDCYLPLLSLAHVFGTTIETIPGKVPYFDVAALRRRKENPALVLPASPRPKIGIAWAGSPMPRNDRHQSCPLQEFLPLLRVSGIDFFTLQKSDSARDLAGLPGDVQVQDLGSKFGDLGDVAVIIDQLDLIISVDIAVAHLAGALVKPVWTLLDYVPAWRWRLTGDTTPWYTTMRLFRQTEPGDWGGVVARVVEELKEWRHNRPAH